MFGIKTSYIPNRERMERILESIRTRKKQAREDARTLAINKGGEVVRVRSD